MAETAVLGGLFFVALPLQVSPGVLEAPPELRRHLAARRARPAERFRLVGADGTAWLTQVESVQPRATTLRLLTPLTPPPRGSPQVQLAFGMMEPKRLEWLLEKATELGAAALHPLRLARTQGPHAARWQQAGQARAQAIILAAAGQSENYHPPVWHGPSEFDDWLHAQAKEAASASSTCLLLDATAPLPLSQWIARQTEKPQRLHVLSGCEGGLTSAERDKAIQAGAVPVALGSRVLRAETAPLVALAQLALLA